MEKDNPLKVTAGSSLCFAAQEVPGAYKAARDLGRGRVRSTLGISGAIRPVLTTFGTPLITGLYGQTALGQHTFFDMSVNIGQAELSPLIAEG